MNLKTYVSRSPKNYVTKDTTELESVNVNIRGGQTPEHMEIVVKLENQCNYAWLEGFGYYFVSCELLDGGMYRLIMDRDALTTFFNDIKKIKCVVSRNSEKWNLMLNDGSFKTYQNPHIVQKTFPQGFTTNMEYVLCVLGAQNAQPIEEG